MSGIVLYEILFPAESQLDGFSAQLISDLGGEVDVVPFEPVAKTAPHELLVKMDRVDLMTGNCGHAFLHGSGDLVADPDIDAIVGHLDGRSDRFQGLVGDIRSTIFRIEHLGGAFQRGLDITFVAPLGIEPFFGERGCDSHPMIALFSRIG